MKATVCVLVLCLAYASAAAVENPISHLEKLVDEQKRILTKLSDDSINNILNISKNAETRLNDAQLLTKRRVDSIVESGDSEIREKAERVKGEHNAIKCYDTAKVKFNTLIETTYNLLKKCDTIVKGSLADPFDNIALTIGSAVHLLYKLDNVIPSCKNADFDQLEKCVTSTLAQIKTQIQQLETEAEDAKLIALSTVETAVSQAKVCNRAVIDTTQNVVFGAKGIKEVAILCIWFAS